jgi:phage-related tail fiber protein
VQTAIAPDLTPYINKNGSVAMTAELTLSSPTPAGSLSAAPKQYVDTGLATKQATLGFTPVNKSGDTGVGSLALLAGSTLTLAVDPVAALQAATKQYVDTGLATKQASLGFTPINKAGDTGIGSLTIGAGNTLTLAADPALPLQASTKAYVDAQVVAAGPGRVPAGAVMAFYRSTPPTGWLECNGQSAAAYPNLVAIGVITTPDLRGFFVRGWDNSRGIDPGRALGTAQEDAFEAHSHGFLTKENGTGGSAAWNGQPDTRLFYTNTTATGGTETRPKNIALMYCIKT